MLNQSFSEKNLRKIFDYENRKGFNIESKFNFETNYLVKQIKEKNREIRKEKDKERRALLFAEKDKLRADREEKLKEVFINISKIIDAPNFSIPFRKIRIKNKDTYLILENIGGIAAAMSISTFGGVSILTKGVVPKREHFFAMKQLLINVKKSYNLKTPSRTSIANQFCQSLRGKFKKTVIKLDIENFYENIPHDYVLDKVNDDNLISIKSKKLIRKIIAEYKGISGLSNGIPRGLGISAYLAEIYMKSIDLYIKKIPNVVFYARYVDDIIIILSNDDDDNINNIYNKICDYVEGDRRLPLNKDKGVFKVDAKPGFCIDYLGYKFIIFNDKKINVSISAKRLEKYKRKINLIFSEYFRNVFFEKDKAERMLIRRVRFLTSNVKLTNSKNGILVGIYYSNIMINKEDFLDILDNYLSDKIDRVSKIEKTEFILNKLRKYNFKDGFRKRRFTPLSTNELGKITKIWK